MEHIKQYKCPECNEYGDSKLWDEETLKHYDEYEHEYIQSIASDNKNSCEFYCFNCKSLVNGKDIKINDNSDTKMKIIKIVVNKLPKDCSECTLHEGEYCKIKGNVTGSEWIDVYSDSRDDDCPLEVV